MRSDFYMDILRKQLYKNIKTRYVTLEACGHDILAILPECKYPHSFLKNDIKKLADKLLPPDMLVKFEAKKVQTQIVPPKWLRG